MRLKIIMYISWLVYLAYSLLNIEAWVTSHTGEYTLYAGLPLVVAAVLLLFRLVGIGKSGSRLPLFFFAIGVIVCLAGISIPCCTGG